MRIFSFIVFILVLNGLTAWLINLPQPVGSDVPAGKLNSLSFAPYREGQGPMQKKFPNAEQIEADLKLMGEKTHNIRTYASAEGSMPVIPELAKKYGLTVLQGAWLNSLHDKNKIEIAELIRSANAHPDVVKRVIVGNEVLLRGDLPAERLIEYIREVKRSVKQPVTYADVWSMYMKYPQLIKEVDFITIHILPYWEDRPISVEDAPEHIKRIVENVRREADTIAPNKPILIGESGWPGAGRQRGSAVPSVINEAKFIRSFIQVVTEQGFDYNIVEAFNQPWKSQFEGVVGANWGLYDANRQEVFPLTGKVYEHPKWLKSLAVSSLIFLMVSLRFWQSLQSLTTARLLGFLVFLQLLSVLLVQQMEVLWYTSYSDMQRLLTATIVGLSIVLAGLLAKRAHSLLAEQPSGAKVSKHLYNLYYLYAVFALYKTYQLAVDGRYISFPNAVTSVLVIGLLGLMVMRALGQARWTWQAFNVASLIGEEIVGSARDKLLGSLLVLMGLALIIGETYAFMVSRDLIAEQPETMMLFWVSLQFTLGNCQLLAWLASLIIMAIPLLLNKTERSLS